MEPPQIVNVRFPSASTSTLNLRALPYVPPGVYEACMGCDGAGTWPVHGNPAMDCPICGGTGLGPEHEHA